MRFSTLTLAVAVAATSVAALAEIKMPKVFSDNMVLQRGIPDPVWGVAEPGETITVAFGGQKKEAKVEADGKWMVKLDPVQADAKGQEMVVSGTTSKSVTFKDVVSGEVWICSGQSNMQFGTQSSLNAKDEVAAANYPDIRLLSVNCTHSKCPIPSEKLATGGWVKCSPATVGGFTAVGYFFGRELYKELNVPVGLVGTSWGGTRIEPWTPPEGFALVPELKSTYDQVLSWNPKTEQGKAAYAVTLDKIEKWLPQAKEDFAAGKDVTPIPLPPGDENASNNQAPTRIYNSMIAPLIPYGIRGAIWYQGESNNCDPFPTYTYKKKAMIEGWRKLWNQGDFPFYFVQLANFTAPSDSPAGGGWGVLREEQVLTLSTVPNTGMALAIDIGDAGDIHPKNKQDVGARLAFWALAKDYGKKELVYSGPLFKAMKVEGSKARVSFDQLGSGLMVGKKDGFGPAVADKDGKLAQFSLKQKGGAWFWADAAIDGDDVLVWSDKVTEPEAVRYAFQSNPVGCNLYNKEGLPASPFTTVKP